MTAVENPIDGIARENIGYLLFSGEHNKRRLQQTGAHLQWRLCFRDRYGARSAGLE
jgi:hypothetical protein